MQRYYFHLQKLGESGVVADEEGSELTSLDAAREEALKAAREILADAIRAGYGLVTEAIIVSDDAQRELVRVALKDALPETIVQQCRQSHSFLPGIGPGVAPGGLTHPSPEPTRSLRRSGAWRSGY